MLTCGSSSATGATLRCSNKRTPSPSRNGTRSMWISSSSPALRHWCTIVAEATTTFLTPAISFACSSALSTPSVTKVTGHSSLTHSGGGRWVTTTTGAPTGWWPPHPLVSSYNLRPATNAPVVLMASSNLSTLSAAILSFCSFLPIVRVYSVSPLVIQAKRCWKSSLGPATKPSRDIENPVVTFPAFLIVLLLLAVECDKVLRFVQLLHIFDQIIPGHAHSLQDTYIDSDFQSRCTGELDTSSHSRFTSLFREDHGGQVLGHTLDGVGMLIGEGRGIDQLLRGYDLAVHAARPLILILWRTHAVVPDATRPQVDGTDGNGVRLWCPPALEMFRLGENLKHQRAGCGELPFHDKFLFPNIGAQRLVIKHWCPQFGCWCVARGPAIPVGSRPDDRSVLPKGDEKIVARTPTPGMAHASAYKFSCWPAAGPPQWQSRSEP